MSLRVPVLFSVRGRKLMNGPEITYRRRDGKSDVFACVLVELRGGSFVDFSIYLCLNSPTLSGFVPVSAGCRKQNTRAYQHFDRRRHYW